MVVASPNGAAPRHPLPGHNPTCPGTGRQGFRDKNKEIKGMLHFETKQIVHIPFASAFEEMSYQLSDEPLLHPAGLQSGDG